MWLFSVEVLSKHVDSSSENKNIKLKIAGPDEGTSLASYMLTSPPLRLLVLPPVPTS